MLRLLLLLPLLLAACGDLPEPFLGNPGVLGRMLSKPPTPRLAVPGPANALLPDASRQHYAEALAAGLQAREVPAVAAKVRASDWQLVAAAEMRGASVIPTFHVLDPKGEDKGQVEGAPVPAEIWASATPGKLDEIAFDAAPKITDLLNGIQAAALHADPNSLYNRIARVQISDVTGAPGDGNTALTRQIKAKLSALGPVVQDSAAGADFIVQGDVKLTPIPGNQQRVEIVWAVKTPAGDERGKVVQLNDVPTGTLNGYWGDIALVVATEAAGGLNDVINRQSGREPGEPVHGQGQKPLVEGRKAGVEPVE